jgi:mRNA-degrading endonuclease RelE of RelBE toxin-antitoxin system
VKVEISPDLLREIRKLSKAKRAAIGAAIESASRAWGRPHEHSGLGIRNLGSGLYECRSGLDQRLLFQSLDGLLYFHFLGDHDEVRYFLRSHR